MRWIGRDAPAVSIGKAIGAIEVIYKSYATMARERGCGIPIGRHDFFYRNDVSRASLIAISRVTGYIQSSVPYDQIERRLDFAGKKAIRQAAEDMVNLKKRWLNATKKREAACAPPSTGLNAELLTLCKELANPILVTITTLRSVGMFLDDHLLFCQQVAQKDLDDLAPVQAVRPSSILIHIPLGPRVSKSLH